MPHFKNVEQGYLDCLNANPSGYVANARAQPDPNYLVLHHSSCRTIHPGRNYLHGAFTERGYSKIVATTQSGLNAEMHDLGINDFSKYCSLCMS